MIARPVMRYPGGKYRIANWVISHFPIHKVYVEPFGGAASILLRKPRSVGEVYNDLDDEVVNVFRILRSSDSKELIRLLALTPYARSEYLSSYEYCDDPIERARRTIYRSFAGFKPDACIHHSGCFRTTKNELGMTAGPEWASYPIHLKDFVERLQGVVIEQRDAHEIIDIYDTPDTLFYVDPPYVKSTRSTSSVRYSFEMTDDQHVDLANHLKRIKGMVCISGYSGTLYDDLYSSWRQSKKSSYTQGNRSVECLWLSPNIQTTLF